MTNKIRISCVSYLNAKPFIYGLMHSPIMDQVELSLDNPAECARKLLSGEAEIGLVPAAVIPQMKSCSIISDFCIGADGPVKSVTLLSNVPLSEIKTILLDYQSRTSVQLIKIIADKLWKISPGWIETSDNYEKNISGNTAGLVIGDRSLELRNSFPFAFDLSDEWKKFTGLPFVFACWVSAIDLSESFKAELNKAFQFGLNNIEAISMAEKNPEEVLNYLSKNISFHLDNKKRKGMEFFLGMIPK